MVEKQSAVGRTPAKDMEEEEKEKGRVRERQTHRNMRGHRTLLDNR